MLRYVPEFIMKCNNEDRLSGSFRGFVLFVDIADFTLLSNSFQRVGKKGAEALNYFLKEALSYPIEAVEKHDGFVTHFAGDAFCAVFPHTDATKVKHAYEAIRLYFSEHNVCKTEIGESPIKVRIAMSEGKIDWQIYRNDKQNEYVFSGEPFKEIVILSELKKELALSKAVRSAFKLDSNSISKPQEHKHHGDNEPKRAFLSSRLQNEKPDNEIRDAAYCFINMSGLQERQKSGALSLIHNKLDDYGGFLNKLDASDKGLVALVLFGLPKALGNTLERACRFALEIMADQPELSIGLACGNAYAGYVGSDYTNEYTALGSAVNLAARLMQKASKSEILTDSYLKQELKYKYRFETDEEVSLKGFSVPVQSYRLIDRLRTVALSYVSNLVDREAELTAIRQAVVEPGSKIIYISGEPGVGKSRLIAEALQQFPARYFLFCDPSGHRSLETIKQFLRQYFSYDPLLSTTQNQKNFREKWSKLAGDDKELLRVESLIGDLLGYEWPASIWSMLPPEERPEQQKKSFATLLAKIAQAEQIIIHLDDPQWLDVADKEYLRQLGMAKIDGIRIIAACRYNDDGSAVNLDIPNWEDRHLDLNRLTKEAAGTMISYLMKVDTLPRETLDWIVKKADGNPLFIEQVVAYLRENNCFDSDYSLKGNLDFLGSFGIADIIGSRIDNLTESVRNTLQHACVLGLEFDTQVLSEMLSRKLEDDLGKGKRARVWADIDELRYIFTHVLIKDTAYNRMLSDKLKKLHLLAAETMERLYQDDEKALNEHAEEIAEHYLAAHIEIHAAKYYVIFGKYLMGMYKFIEAEKAIIQGLEYRKKILGEDHQDSIAALDALAGLYDESNKFDVAEPLHIKVFDVTEQTFGLDHPNTANSLNSLALCYGKQGNYTQAEELFQRALSIKEKVFGQSHPEILTSLGNLACLFLEKGSYDYAETLLARSIEIMENNPGTENAFLFNNLASTYNNQGKYKEAELYYHKALNIFQKSEYKIGPKSASVLANLSGVYRNQGKFSEAEQGLRQALQLRETIFGADSYESAITLNNLGMIKIDQGSYDQAEPLLLKAISIFEKYFIEDHPVFATLFGNMGIFYSNACKYEQAETMFLKALSIREKSSGENHPETARVISNLASLYFKIKKIDNAEVFCLKSLEIKEKTLGTEHPDTVVSMNNLAYVYNEKQMFSEAQSLFMKALHIREKVLGVDHPETAESLIGLACSYIETGEYYKAEPMYIRAIDIRLSTLGLEHPATQKTIKSLAETYEKLDQYDKAAEYRSMLVEQSEK